MGQLYKKIIINDVTKIHENINDKVAERAEFRLLPLMDHRCCDGQIGAVNAESFAERIISCANYFLEMKALQPFNMAVVVPDIEEAKGEF